VPFYQTNPPILSWKTDVIQQCSNGLHNKIVLENGGFVLENEPTGSGILVGFGCRDNYFAASRRTRFGKRTHREGVLGPRKRRFGENEPRLVCSENDMYAFEVELVRWKRSGVGVLGGGLGMQAVELAGETPAPHFVTGRAGADLGRLGRIRGAHVFEAKIDGTFAADACQRGKEISWESGRNRFVNTRRNCRRDTTERP
jgi:hypothetical protein